MDTESKLNLFSDVPNRIGRPILENENKFNQKKLKSFFCDALEDSFLRVSAGRL